MILCEIYYASNRPAGLAVIFTDGPARSYRDGNAPGRRTNPCVGSVIHPEYDAE